MIAATMGTPYEISTQDVILFIEDINEPLYRIDRLLTHLRLAGKLQQLRGCWSGMWREWTPRLLHACSSRPLPPCAFRYLPGGAVAIAIPT